MPCLTVSGGSDAGAIYPGELKNGDQNAGEHGNYPPFFLHFGLFFLVLLLLFLGILWVSSYVWRKVHPHKPCKKPKASVI